MERRRDGGPGPLTTATEPARTKLIRSHMEPSPGDQLGEK